MNAFFLDNFINSKELNHLAKEVKKKQLNTTICAINRFNEMQNNIIKEKKLNTSQYIQKKLSQKNAKKYF